MMDMWTHGITKITEVIQKLTNMIGTPWKNTFQTCFIDSETLFLDYLVENLWSYGFWNAGLERTGDSVRILMGSSFAM
jgi:hypothetical protein